MKPNYQISEDALKEILKAWKAKNEEDLKEKSSNKNSVSVKMFELSEEAKNILLYIIKNNEKELSSIDIAYALKYGQKQLSQFFNALESMKKLGLIYLKIKRRRLNSNDDSVYILPYIYETLKKIIVENRNEIKDTFEENYNSNVYKKYEKNIIALYENGFILEYKKLNLEDDDIIALCKANIIGIYFDLKTEAYAVLNNVKVISNVEKNLKTIIASSVYVYNHKNILNDIDNFLYELDVQKIRLGDENENIKFLTDNITSEYIINICIKLELIQNDAKNYLSANYENIEHFLSKDIEERIKKIIDTVYKEYYNIFNKIINIIDSLNKNEKDISKAKLFLSFKEKHCEEITLETFNNILYSMFTLGMIETVFYESSIISIKKTCEESKNSKCIINGNFELTLINHQGFSDDFIYMCNSYFSLEKQESVYTYSINEETILKGKVTEIKNSKYRFENIIKSLHNILEENGANMPKHVETSITRWYDRITKSLIYENITLINIQNVDKLDEIIHEAKRKNIEINKINEEYAIISSHISKKTLIKFLRQKRVIVTF